MKVITYAIDSDTGLVVSRVGNEVAWPILDYEGMGPANGYALGYSLEKMDVFKVPPGTYSGLRWTKKIPVNVKNAHRAFWGMKPLKA